MMRVLDKFFDINTGIADDAFSGLGAGGVITFHQGNVIMGTRMPRPPPPATA